MDSVKKKVGTCYFYLLGKLNEKIENQLDKQENQLDEQENQTEIYTRHDFKPIESKEIQKLKELEHFINSGCTNIGILGGYATGKSSIIVALKKHIKNPIFIISASNFEENISEKEDGELTAYGILIHQLHMYISEKNYINSDLKLKKKIPKLTMFIHMAAWISFISIFLYQKYFINYVNYEDLVLYNVLISYKTQIFSIVFLLMLISIAIIIYDISKGKYSKFSYKGNELLFDNKIEKNDYISSESQILIELLIELYLEKTKCIPGTKRKRMVIVVEDVDRFEKLEILQILYNVSSILEKKNNIYISFIYSIDPQFVPKDATKFFDAIIDVSPFYDKYNSGTKITELLSEIGIPESELDVVYTNNIGLYCADIRVLKRIVNQYAQLREVNSDSKKEILFSLCVLKVLYPEYLSMKPSPTLDNLEWLIEKVYNQKENLSPIEIFSDLIEKEKSYEDASPYEELPKDVVRVRQLKNNENLIELLNFLFQNEYFDKAYKWFITNSKQSYSEKDSIFIDNYQIDGTIPLYADDLDIDDAERFIKEFVSYEMLRLKKSILSVNVYNNLIERYNSANNIELYNAFMFNLAKNFEEIVFHKIDLFKIYTKEYSNLEIEEPFYLEVFVVTAFLDTYKEKSNTFSKEVKMKYIDFLLPSINLHTVDGKLSNNEKEIVKEMVILMEENVDELAMNEKDKIELLIKYHVSLSDFTNIDEQYFDKIYTNNMYDLTRENIKYISNKNCENTYLFERWKNTDIEKFYIDETEEIYIKFIEWLIEEKDETFKTALQVLKEGKLNLSYEQYSWCTEDTVNLIFKKNFASYELENIVKLFNDKTLSREGLEFNITSFINCLPTITNNNKEEVKNIVTIYFNRKKRLSAEDRDIIEKIKDNVLLNYLKAETLEITKDKRELLQLLSKSKDMMYKLNLLKPNFVNDYINYNVEYYETWINSSNQAELLKLIPNVHNKLNVEIISKKVFSLVGEKQIELSLNLKPKVAGWMISSGIHFTYNSLKEYLSKTEFDKDVELILLTMMSYKYKYSNEEKAVLIVDGIPNLPLKSLLFVLENSREIPGYTFEILLSHIKENFDKLENHIGQILIRHEEQFPSIITVYKGEKSSKKLVKELEYFEDKVFEKKFYKAFCSQLNMKITKAMYVKRK